VTLIGPRQRGKTTLVQQFGGSKREYVTLNDDTVLEAVRNDPAVFVRGFDLVTTDEVQRAPELLRAIKRSVDSDRRPGRFLLTGSANILTLPPVSESLAGRMETVNLMPISRAEILGKDPAFLKMAFNSKLVKPGPILERDQLLHDVLVGGYPEMLRRGDSRRRQAWARDYVKAIVQRDVRDVAKLEKLDHCRAYFRRLHISPDISQFQPARWTDWNGRQNNAKVRVSPWFRNELKRLIKTPKRCTRNSCSRNADIPCDFDVQSLSIPFPH
jgi:predicted AAA+ superfamily ATPase